MSDTGSKSSISTRRKHPRVDCGDATLNAVARFGAGDGGGETQEFRMIARNVSQSGISFWREKPMGIGSSCTLALPTRDGEMMGIEGKVVFSKRIGITVNEIGIEFDRPLDSDEFSALAVGDAEQRRSAG